ncbi:MAG: type I DNA topoisomerase [Lachnospiraceae bacterium]|nr:type I DNA topoisomerase [Lachnospiraceae bacterium]
MPRYLVIVESPAKAKTIKKFLGSSYTVEASNGHVRDLPKSQLGFDPEHGFEPKYITIRGKGDLLAHLRKEVAKADRVYLATDPDREGEAISWHLAAALNLQDKKYSRITFNEITKTAVKASIKQAREIDQNLVDAQQARRVLDRMVGYSISPLLWKKIKRGLSAGRVQSAALRIICDRENEIAAFIPQEYWSIDLTFGAEKGKKSFTAHYFGEGDQKRDISSKEEADAILKDLTDASYVVNEVKRGERMRQAPLPFTTSTLQQEAAKTLGFPTQKTMRLAQQLYEGVDVKSHGTIGLITYLRTDSTRVSEEAEGAAKTFIEEHYGETYYAVNERKISSGNKIQDAHEAIRPTYVDLTPAAVKDSLQRDQFRLYQLIWKRFVGSRMKAAVYETLSMKIDSGSHRFTSSASQLKYDGFLSVYQPDEDSWETQALSDDLSAGTVLNAAKVDAKQHFTQPPAHYTEAALVRAMEELGIGRPSTYAPIITTILGRRYVVRENKNLYVTELGEAVNHLMVEGFPSIVDVTFTANMESLLDGVEEGNVNWKTVVSNFYPDLMEAVKEAQENMDQIKIEDEKTDEICDVCGRQMVIKYGPHGKFLACPGFPECRNTKPYLEKIGVPCPLCGKDIVVRKTKKGRRYYGCENNPECSFMSWFTPTNEKCPKCGNVLLKRGNRLVCMNEECGFVKENE